MQEDVTVDSSLPKAEEVVKTDVKTEVPAPKTEDKTVPYERFKEVNEKVQSLETKLKSMEQPNKQLDVEDYIDISASLEGLDQREKEKLARESKLTGRPLKEIREDEDFKLWQQAYQVKKSKEKALEPSTTQTESEKPKSLADKLRGASLEEKEKILLEQGLYRNPRGNPHRVNIGPR